MKTKRFSTSLEIAGLALIVWGLWTWQPIAAYIVGGLVLIVLAQGLSRRGES